MVAVRDKIPMDSRWMFCVQKLYSMLIKLVYVFASIYVRSIYLCIKETYSDSM